MPCASWPLRRTADRVDDQMRAWRDLQGQGARLAHAGRHSVMHWSRQRQRKTGSHRRPACSEVWQRLARGLRRNAAAAWPARKSAPRHLSALRLAQELGAETATLSDPQEDKAILRYAREHNLGKIVIGRRQHRRWFSRESFADRLARRAPDLDLVIVALDDKPAPCPTVRRTLASLAINGAFRSGAAWWPWSSAP